MYNRKDESSQNTVVAYTMFRFEPGYEDEASLYWYISPQSTHVTILTSVATAMRCRFVMDIEDLG